MKIDHSEGIHSTPHPEKNTPGPEKPAQGFGEIFQKALKTETPQTISPVATSFVRPVIPVVETALAPDNKVGVVEAAENLLDLLEEYRRHLIKPESQPKEIDALVQRLEGQRERLAPVIDTLPEGDGLKPILNRSLITTTVEIFKYRRGDYLDA